MCEIGRRAAGLLAVAVFWAAAANVCAAQDAKKKVLLLAQGPDGHAAGTHEYRAGMNILAACLAPQKKLEVKVVSADGPWAEGPGLIKDADCVVTFVSEGARWVHEDARRLEALAAHAAGGGGLVTLHWGMGTRDARYVDGYLKLFGGCHGGPDRKYKDLETTLRVASRDHPIVRGIGDLELREEFYYKLKFVKADPGVRPVLRAKIDGSDETVAWAWQRNDGGRSFGFSGGHFHHNWRRVEYRRLMAQAVLWSLKIDTPKEGLKVDVPAKLFELKKVEEKKK